MKSGYFSKLHEAFTRANQQEIKKSFLIANQSVHIQVANDVLAQKLLPALAHLEQSHGTGQTPDLTVFVWDSATSGIDLPPFIVQQCQEHNPRGWINTPQQKLDRSRLLYMNAPDEFLCFFDPDHKRAIYWYRDAHTIPYYERATPMRSLFDCWLESRGLIFTHAAAIGNDKGGVLIVGKGGQGKSTTAISSIESDSLYYAADDYLILDPADTPIVYSLYNTGKLHFQHLAANLPNFIPFLENPSTAKDEKGIFFFHQTHQQKLKTAIPLVCALLPQVNTAHHASFSPISPMRLLIGLAASTIYQSIGKGEMALKGLSKTLSNLPCYALETGNDPNKIPQVIQEIIDKHARN